MARRKNRMFASFVSIFLGLVLLSSLGLVAYAHEESLGAMENPSQNLNTTVIALATVVILSSTIMLINYKDTIDQHQKRIIFIVIAMTSLISTGYLVGNTIYISLTSWSGGLIHWHADFEIWICDQKVILPAPNGLSNRVGDPTVHHHGDSRIHLEGIIKNREDATLGNFFDVINVTFSNEKILNMKNGDYCPDGKKGTVKMFDNNKPYTGDYRDYVISPYFNVPPGDFIKIVFE